MLWLLGLALSISATASELVPQDSSSLLGRSRFVVIGKVIESEFNPTEHKGSFTVAVQAVLKGRVDRKTLTFPVDKKPLDGFDVLLEKGEVGVFFVREIKSSNARLAFPGASAVFPKGYLN